MAIEFLCPHCRSAIRVPDTAAGKQGTCPGCRSKLLVPRLTAPEDFPAEAGLAAPPVADRAIPSAAIAPQPFIAGGPVNPLFSQLPGSSPEVAEQTPAGPYGAPAHDVTPAIQHRVRKRHQKPTFSFLWILPVLLLGGGLAGVLFYAVYEPPLKLEGELTATVLPEDAGIPSGFVGPAAGDFTPEVVDGVLQRLKDRPISLGSQFVRVEFRGQTKRIEVTVSGTALTEVVIVPIRSDTNVQKFLKQHGSELAAARDKELSPAVQSFFRDMAKADPNLGPLSNLAVYRDGIGLPAMTEGMGYCTEAIVKNVVFRCVHEDKEGRLYFIVPAGTGQFLIRGRKLPDGRTLFPGTYHVKVQEAKPAAEPEKPKRKMRADEAEGEPDNSGEMQPKEPPADSDNGAA